MKFIKIAIVSADKLCHLCLKLLHVIQEANHVLEVLSIHNCQVFVHQTFVQNGSNVLEFSEVETPLNEFEVSKLRKDTCIKRNTSFEPTYINHLTC